MISLWVVGAVEVVMGFLSVLAVGRFYVKLIDVEMEIVQVIKMLMKGHYCVTLKDLSLFLAMVGEWVKGVVEEVLGLF